MNKGNNYDKIKHLVEVDDDILASFYCDVISNKRIVHCQKF